MNELSLMSKHLNLNKGATDEMVRHISHIIMHNNGYDIDSLMIAINSLNDNM